MSNHFHLIWQMCPGNDREDVQRNFLKFVGQSIKLDLRENHPNVLERFKVNLKDREYQIFKRNALSVDLFTRPVIEQKLDYVHNNPVKAGICTNPEDYRFSSARYYLTGEDEFSFLSNIFE